jgi:hypothetical protein
VEQKRLGKFQIEIGWLLVVVTIIIGIVGYWLLLSRFLTAFSGLTETWRDAAKAVQSGIVAADVISYALVLSLIFFVGIILFAVLLLLLFSIAILFITQGTANVNLAKSLKKEELNIAEAKRKFRNIFAISFVIILLGTLLFFNPFPYFYRQEYGFGFGFPAEYAYFINNTLSHFSLYGFIINLLFALVVSYGIGLIYYRLILGLKKF